MKQLTDLQRSKSLFILNTLLRMKNGNWKLNIEYLDLVVPETQSALNIKVIYRYLKLAYGLDCY